MSRQKLWKPFIVFASYFFYACANPKFCLLLGGITLGNQAAAKLLHRTDDERRRSWIVGAAVTLDLLVLAVFKYYGFFTQSIADPLAKVGMGMPLPLLTIRLPVGVSFFTFQAISYVVDVKRGLIEPASTLDVAIYLSFFPHLVAGPIVRAREFLPQLQSPRDPKRVAVGSGIALIGLGLIKKVVVADYLARTVVDPVFAVPQSYSAPDVALAAYSYTAQIYCDFSGYTDIAIGLALLMGFVFPQNFDRPYRSLGVREFWRRWPMTLSRFLRAFLYIPLGGNRGPRWFVYRNLLITMVLGGLWHGVAWTFVLWGAMHGSALCLEHAFARQWERVPKWVRWSITFNFVVVAWVFFRSQSIGDAWDFLGRLFDPGPARLWAVTPVALAAGVIGFQLLPPRPLQAWRLRFERLNPVALATALTLVILFVGATVPSQGVAPFIYFRF